MARSSRLATPLQPIGETFKGEMTSGISTNDHDEWYRLVVHWPQEHYRTQGHRHELLDLVSPQ